MKTISIAKIGCQNSSTINPSLQKCTFLINEYGMEEEKSKFAN